MTSTVTRAYNNTNKAEVVVDMTLSTYSPGSLGVEGISVIRAATDVVLIWSSASTYHYKTFTTAER